MSHGEFAEIGKYRILGQIGEGAMGIVYRAQDVVLDRPVAIKVMNDALARDTDLRNRFLREAQSAGSLQHPNVVTVYDFGEVDGHLFIAMEYVEGIDLNQLLYEKRPLSLVQKIDVLVDVLNGLAYAHKRGIVHRDIKPANIRIDDEGRARIMDFGIAHLSSSSMTRTGMTMGTPAYMSPEQIAGGTIGAASDLFSVGAVMYEIFTGVQAFRGDTLQSVMYQIVSGDAPRLTIEDAALTVEQNAGVSEVLGAILGHALARDPAARFASALDMAAALTEVRAHVLEGKDPTAGSTLRATLAKALASNMGTAAATAVPAPATSPPAQPASRRRMVPIAAAASAVVVVGAVGLTLMSHSSSRSGDSTGVPAASALSPDTSSQEAARSGTARDSSPMTAAGNGRGAPATPNSGRQPAAGSGSTGSKSAARSPSARDLAHLRDLQSSALEARRRAAQAGASTQDLDVGDAHLRVANSLILEGKVTDAGDQMQQAAKAWTDIERRARAAATSSSASAANAANAPAPSAASNPASGAAALTGSPSRSDSGQGSAARGSAPVAVPVTPPVQPPSQAQPPAASNPAAEIGAAVSAYARALESRDVEAVRRAYPGITADQAKGWTQFFSTLRSLRVALSVGALDVNGTSADAQVSGTYDYVTSSGKTEHQKVSFAATFARDGGPWRLMAVH